MITKDQLFKQFTPETKTIKVEAWGGQEVEIRKLTIAAQNEIQAVLLKDMNIAKMDGEAIEIGIEQATKASLIAVSKALVNPALTVEELESLGNDAMDGISEIKNALDEWDKPKK